MAIRVLSEKPVLSEDGRILKIQELSGPSGDSKPTTGIANGTLFLESDTGKLLVYDESDGWTEVPSGSGSSLPSVSAADNGKVLAVKDGAWAADKNTIILPITNGKVELTGAEINALVEEGKTVMLAGTDEYDVYAGKYFNVAYFVNMRSTNSTYKSVGSNKNVLTTYTVPLPHISASDNGSELIVTNGAWAKQQKKFIVTLTPTAADYSGTMDKTVAEINTAYEAGQEIWFKVAASGYDVLIPMSDCSVSSGFTYPSFDCRMVDITTNVEVCVRTSVTDDGTKATYSTTVYSLTPAS